MHIYWLQLIRSNYPLSRRDDWDCRWSSMNAVHCPALGEHWECIVRKIPERNLTIETKKKWSNCLDPYRNVSTSFIQLRSFQKLWIKCRMISVNILFIFILFEHVYEFLWIINLSVLKTLILCIILTHRQILELLRNCVNLNCFWSGVDKHFRDKKNL